MSKFYRMDPSRWDNGTANLSMEEECALLRIVNAIHKHDEPVVDNDRVLAGFFRCDVRKAKWLKEQLVKAGKIVILDGLIYNDRATTELELRADLGRVRAESGRSGGLVSGQSRRSRASKPLKSHGTGEAIALSKTKENRREENRVSSSLRSDDTRPAAVPPRKSCGQSELETVLDPERAAAVVAHRRKIGSSLTASSALRLAKKLAQWPDPNEAADEMLAAGWRGFEASWLHERRTPRGHSPPNGTTRAQRWGEAVDEVFDEFDRRLEGQAQGSLPSITGPGRGH